MSYRPEVHGKGQAIHGDKTTTGATCITSCPEATVYGLGVIRSGDSTTPCPRCGKIGTVIEGDPRLSWHGRATAVDGCRVLCGCPPGSNRIIAPLGLMQIGTPPQQMASPAPTASPASSIAPAKLDQSRRTSETCVFAKSCVSVPLGSTDAGVQPEPASNFGSTTVLVTTQTLDSGATLLGRAGGTLAQGLGSWAISGGSAAGASATGASGAATIGSAATAAGLAGTVLLALWPRDLGDGTLYTPEQLAAQDRAASRVRFQFRRDSNGAVHVYGLHTRPGGGKDSVPITHARWDAGKSAMVADLGGISITWTPNDGPLATAPTATPGIPVNLNNLLVHPIPEGRDSQITTYPGQGLEDITWQDTIIVFPADSGVPPLYLVFAKPTVRLLEVGFYGSFDKRPRNGTHLDHIPSKKALERRLKDDSPDIETVDIKRALRNAASIAIPAWVHQQHSETYGARNTIDKQILDAANLRAAVDSNFDMIKPLLLKEGFSNTDLEAARTTLHELNQEQGWY